MATLAVLNALPATLAAPATLPTPTMPVASSSSVAPTPNSTNPLPVPALVASFLNSLPSTSVYRPAAGSSTSNTEQTEAAVSHSDNNYIDRKITTAMSPASSNPACQPLYRLRWHDAHRRLPASLLALETMAESLLAPRVVAYPRKAAASCSGLGETFPRLAEMLDARRGPVSQACA